MNEHKRILHLTTQEVDMAYQVEVFQNREHHKVKAQFELENQYLAYVSAGDVAGLKAFIASPRWLEFMNQMGTLSINAFKQELYGAVIGVALLTRAGLKGGLSEDEAYTLSDIYIQRFDECQTLEEIEKLKMKCLFDFTSRVAKGKKAYGHRVSPTVKQAIEYVLGHLHYPISLAEVAKHVGLSDNYFSTLFRKETGKTLIDFINTSKIKEAQNLLDYTGYSLLEISQFLGYSTQSHFTQVFKKTTGMTPGHYRKRDATNQ